jgi:voltage-gated potassium channel
MRPPKTGRPRPKDGKEFNKMKLLQMSKIAQTEKLTPFQLVMLALSVYVIIALFLQLIIKLPLPIIFLLDSFDFIICVIFLFDFFYRLVNSSNKLHFLKWGWIDFISSIPTIDILRWGRLFRVFRILRLLRAFKSTKFLVSYIFQNRAKCSFAAAALISFLLVIFSSIAILTFEDIPSSHIKSPIDALWWSFSTISTTGSGEAYPITSAGKILSVVLAISGVGLFGTFTAYVAKFFIEPSQKQEEIEIIELKKQISILNSKLDNIIEKYDNKVDISIIPREK